MVALAASNRRGSDDIVNAFGSSGPTVKFFVLARSSLRYYENAQEYQLGLERGTLAINERTVIHTLSQRMATAMVKDR